MEPAARLQPPQNTDAEASLLGALLIDSDAIVKIADVYDALRSKRSYKAPASHGETLRVFREGDKRITPRDHFDPELLALFFKIEHIFEKIYESMEEKN